MRYFLRKSVPLLFFATSFFFLALIVPSTLLAQQINTSPVIETNKDTKQTQTHSLTIPTASVTASQVKDSCTAVPPTLLLSLDGAILNDLENPTYYWSFVPNITAYIFQLASEPTFANPLTTEGQTAFIGDTRVRHTSSEDLETGVTYFWRVASVCADGQIGVFAAPASFQAGPGSGGAECTLPPPTLFAPVNGSQVNTLIPTIEWATASDELIETYFSYLW